MPNNLFVYPLGGPPAPPPSPDIFGPTRIVSLIAGDGTDLTIASAIAALPAEGGYIQVKQGTYPVAASLALPDKNVVIRGAGEGATIIDIGGNAIPAFTVPNVITGKRTFTFEDLRIVGTGVAGQRGWSVQDESFRAVLQINRCETREILNPLEVNFPNEGTDPTLIYATDCYFEQVVGSASVLVATSPNFPRVILTMDRVRFYREDSDPGEVNTAVVGQLAQGGFFDDFTDVSIVAVDSFFSLGGVDFTLGALNLKGCEIFNYSAAPHIRIAVASDPSGFISDALVNCNIQFIDFNLAGSGTQLSNCRFNGCSFQDNSGSMFEGCFFEGIGVIPSTAVIVSGSGFTVIVGCFFTSTAEGTSYVISRPDVVSGCMILGTPPVAAIHLTGGGGKITGNHFEAAVPVIETGVFAFLENAISGNFFAGGPPTLLAGNLTLLDDKNIRTISTTPVTLDQLHRTILSDATTGARVINLPSAASALHRTYTIKKKDASVNTVTIDGFGAETIDGIGTVVLTSQWERITIQSDGTAWFRID